MEYPKLEELNISNCTEREVVEQLGFFCIYDSGQYKWELTLRKTL